MSERLSADRPLKSMAEDRLGYAPFARNLARALREMVPAEGLVVALYGSWGAGKSTALNFVEEELEDDIEIGSIVPVHFNPWWFSGGEDLVRRFFSTLISSLDERGARFAEIREKIGELGEILSNSSVPILPWAGAAASLMKLGGKDVYQLKARLDEALRDQASKIVVFVDDVDRLAANEIRDLFRLLKAVGDLPNVIYVLAFDRKVIVAALRGIFSESGEDYLQKIVQVPFNLPVPDQLSLNKMFFQGLDGVLGEPTQDLFDVTRWGNVFHDEIAALLSTPRAVVRLLNACSVTYPAVKDEVNVTDFVALEALRVFDPGVYSTVRDAPERFLGPSRDADFDREGNEFKEFHEGWIENVMAARRPAVVAGIERLFPRVNAALGRGMRYDGESMAQWKRNGRLCHPDVFPIFFRLSTPPGQYTQQQVLRVLEDAEDAGALRTHLYDLSEMTRPDGRTYLRAFLETLWELIPDGIEDSGRVLISTAVAEVGDRLLEVEKGPRGAYEVPLSWQLRAMLGRLVGSLTTDEQRPFLDGLLESEDAGTTTLVMLSEELQPEEGDAGPEPVMSEELAESFRQGCLTRIRREAAEGHLLERPFLGYVLGKWVEWGGKEECDAWVHEHREEDTFLLRTMEAFTSDVSAMTLGDRVPRHEARVDAGALREFLGNRAFERLAMIDLPDDAGARQREAHTQVKAHEAAVRGGR